MHEGVTDWGDRRVRIKVRVEAACDRLEQLRRRRREVTVRPPVAREAQRADYRLVKAAQHGLAAQLAAASQLERTADVHDCAARAHDTAARRACNDLLLIAHMHSAEAYRSTARHDRELARRYREQAGGLGNRP